MFFKMEIGLTPSSLANCIGCTAYGINGLASYPLYLVSKVPSSKISLNGWEFLANGSFDYWYDNSGKTISKSF